MLTSRAEGLPNVMIEAQLVGVPVVCTGSGGMYETFVEGETGFGVREETAEALADAVGQLVADPSLRRSMGERARELARESIQHRADDRSNDRRLSFCGGQRRRYWLRLAADADARPDPARRHVRDRDDCFAADLPVCEPISTICSYGKTTAPSNRAEADAISRAGNFDLPDRAFFLAH